MGLTPALRREAAACHANPEALEAARAEAARGPERAELLRQSLERLGFARCRLSIAIPKNNDFPGPEYLNGKKIATSYPNILKKYLAGRGINSEVHEISGSVEIAPGIGLADAILDIVSTFQKGSSLSEPVSLIVL